MARTNRLQERRLRKSQHMHAIGASRCRGLTSGEIVEDRAIRAVIAVTARNEGFDRRFQRLKLFDLLRDSIQMLGGKGFYIGASTVSIFIEGHELATVLDREAE